MQIAALAIAVVLASQALHAQSLADAAKTTADEQAGKHATDKKAGIAPPPTKVYTNKDLLLTFPPATTPDDAALPSVDVPLTPAALTPVPTAVEIRDAEQRRYLALVNVRQTLADAQRSLHTAESTQRDMQHTYDDSCRGRRPLVQVQSCADMRATLRVELPDLLSRLRSKIQTLEALALAGARSYTR